MSIHQNLVEFQKQQRDAGWRIKSILWHDAGKLEKIDPPIPATPFTLAAVIVWIALLAVSFVNGEPEWTMAFGVGGLVAGILACVYTASQRYQHWVSVNAICCDKEVRSARPQGHEVWTFRVQCDFQYEGKTYAVTPALGLWCNFRKEEAVLKYLNETIDQNGNCLLWVNPDNPLQTSFNTLPKVGYVSS